MPVLLYRVDNRLVHGQVLEGWVPRLGAKKLVVVDGRIARDPFEKCVLESMGQGLMPVEVVPPEEARDTISRAADKKLIVLFKTIEQAKEAFDAGLPIDRLNLGNIHPKEGASAITDSVHVTCGEIDMLAALAEAGVELEARAVPTDTGPDMSTVTGVERKGGCLHSIVKGGCKCR